ncbi:MAG: galactokinase [Pyrinomonadaceae bacterium]
MINIENLKARFIRKFVDEPRIFRAPGRVNLIGEHTDYNDGFVLPCAIDFAAYTAIAPRSDKKIRAASLNCDGEIEIDLKAATNRTIAENWTKFVQGIAFTIGKSGRQLCGANLLIDSDVPLGAGLSSSAALEISIGYALCQISEIEIEPFDLAKIAQIAEHDYAKVKSGIMDPFASVFGRENHALFLDCRSLNWSPIPLSSANFMICNAKTKHDLADGIYNQRRAECERAAKLLNCESLRDVTPEEFERNSEKLPPALRQRARHVITENQRVLKAVEVLRKNDLSEFGRLMNESHQSLRDDFQVSSFELDLMVKLAREQKGVLGARMTGGGFGGCTINLVEAEDCEDFAEQISAEFARQTGITPEIYQCRAKSGAAEIMLM